MTVTPMGNIRLNKVIWRMRVIAKNALGRLNIVRSSPYLCKNLEACLIAVLSSAATLSRPAKPSRPI